MDDGDAGSRSDPAVGQQPRRDVEDGAELSEGRAQDGGNEEGTQHTQSTLTRCFDHFFGSQGRRLPETETRPRNPDYDYLRPNGVAGNANGGQDVGNQNAITPPSRPKAPKTPKRGRSEVILAPR